MAGQIIKRGDNWTVRIFLGRDANGKRQYSNKTIRGTKKDAQTYLTAKLREKDLGLLIGASAISLNAYLDEWLEGCAKPRVSESTFGNYEYLLRLYARDKIGAKHLSDVKPADIQKLYSGMTKAGLSPRTVRYLHAVLNSAFSQAVKRQMIVVNPCAAVDLPRQRQSDRKALSREEVKRFMSAAKEDKFGLVFMFALATGMRPEEYLALKWSDVDFEKGTATVQRTLIWRKGGGCYFGEPKTAKSRRTVPLPQGLLRDLKAHKTEQLATMLRLGSGYERNDLVFPTETGKPIYLANLRQRHFHKIAERAGLQGLRIYELRHTMATLLLAEGVNPKIVSERLGHASIVLTLDTYSHVLPDMQKEATSQLGQMLYG